MDTDRDDLQRQIAELTARVYRLEQQLGAAEGGHAAPAEAAAALPVAEPVLAGTPATAAKQAGERRPSLETRVGSQLFNRIGIIALLIGVAWFLKFAFENHWIGPAGRVAIGLLCGAGLIAWSERFRQRGFATFSYSLKALGSGILYLSLWAAFSVYALIPSGIAFAAMILVTASNGFLAWKQEAELLAVYAIVGGFSTPLLLSTGRNEEVTLFTYLLVLNVAVMALLTVRAWTRLLVLAFVATASFFIGWFVEFYTAAQFPRTAVFLVLFFGLFAFAALFSKKSAESTATARKQAAAARVLVSLANGVFGFLGFYPMLEAGGSHGPAEAWCALAFGAFYLGAFYAGLRQLFNSRPDVPHMLPAAAEAHLALAAAFLTTAIPLGLHTHWITIGWLSEGAGLMLIAPRLRTLTLRPLAAAVLALGLVSLAWGAMPAQTRVIVNPRFGTFAVAIGAFAATLLIARHAMLSRSVEISAARILLPWPVVASVALALVNLLVLAAVAFEIHTYWWSQPLTPGTTLFAERSMHAQFTYSAWGLLLGAGLLAVGFWRKSAFLRWQALILLAADIAKVFLVDTSQLTQGYRIVSFIGLGVLLLVVSFVYQRDWLGLRGAS